MSIHRGRSAAEKLGKAFFRGHPDRRYWARASLPHEQPGWSADQHLRWPAMLCIRHENGFRHEAVPLSCSVDELPTDDAGLGAIWMHLSFLAAREDWGAAGKLEIVPGVSRELIVAPLRQGNL